MGYYKKYGCGIRFNRIEINNKYRVCILDFDANPHDREVYHYGLIVEEIRDNKLIFEKDYKTYRGVVRAYHELVNKMI